MKSSSIPSLVLGGILSLLFYGAIHKGLISQPLVVRYFAGHPIEYITTIMFFVGIAILIVKYASIFSQRKQLLQSPILPSSPKPLPVAHANRDIDFVLNHEKEQGISSLSDRLKTVLTSIHRNGSADDLNAEIRCRAEDAAEKADSDYGLVRLILWAVPMLGFLGTVIGITAALDNLDLNTISESSQKLSAGLAVAFDTTGLAIALDVLLFFVQFLVYRQETNLLTETDRQTELELCGRFEQNIAPKDNDAIFIIRQMLETVTAAVEQAAEQQTRIWEKSMILVEQRYAQLTRQSEEMLKSSLASALNESIEHHAEALAKSESKLLSQANQTAMQFSETMTQSTANVIKLQEATVQQTETVREILGTNSQLLQMEDRLQENLSVLAHVGNFEETVNSLAAVIHLLNNNRRSELRAG